MDEIRRLEEQIRQLQFELQRQRSEAADMRQNLANQNLRKLREYETEMRDKLNEHDEQTQKEYERLLKEYERSLNEEIQDQEIEMDVEYQNLLASTQMKEREWIEKTKRLEQLIEEVKKNTMDKDSASANEAKKYLAEASEKYKEIDSTPHEKFFPNRMKIFFNALSDAKSFCKRGLNEAAIATSISARSGLSRLGYDIDEQFKEWERLYQLLKIKVGHLHMKLIDEMAVWYLFSDGIKKTVKRMTAQEKENAAKSINFWSRGVYGDVSNRIAAIGKRIGRAEKKGVLQYLKTEESSTLDEIKKYISDCDDMDEEIENAFILYKERYTSACQRSDWGELIIDFLTDEINLVWLEDESTYRVVSEDDKDKVDYKDYMLLKHGNDYDQIDMREWLELVFENSLETKIFIYIVPYEVDTHVENRLVLYIDYSGATNDDYSRQIYAHICESVHLEDDDGVVSFASDVDQLKANPNATLRAAGKSIETKIKKMR